MSFFRKTTVMALMLLVSFLVGAAPVILHGQDRVALLIANSDYGEHQLPEAQTQVATLS